MPYAKTKRRPACRYRWCRDCHKTVLVYDPDDRPGLLRRIGRRLLLALGRRCRHVGPARHRFREGEVGLTTARRVELRQSHYGGFERDTSGAVKY